MSMKNESTDHIFISHSSDDDAFVKNLRKSLELQGLKPWIDSRELAPGAKLEKKIKTAIDTARAFFVVLSPNAFNSHWVQKEVKYALKVQKKKTQPEDFPVVPIMLEGADHGALGLYFDDEPVGTKINMGPGGISEAMPQLLSALGERLPDDFEPMLNPEAEPLEELRLELQSPCIIKVDSIRRAQATAQLVYVPADKSKREVTSKQRFLFTAPLGPIEHEELSWYLERYYMWPTGVFKDRAERVEEQLPKWGKALYDAVVTANLESVLDVLTAWKAPKTNGVRRFTVFVDSRLVKGADEAVQAEANEAATLLLALPWELLHDDRNFLFQGANPVRVRRRLPNRLSLEGAVTEPPIRILLVSPRPEDDSAGYIDHRVSALPLVTAVENLGEIVNLTVLTPPTFEAFQQALISARKAGTPFHVVHFDGHGVYRRDLGLGGLCFEDPRDHTKLEKRASRVTYAKELSAVIRDHRIPLVFLEACQSAEAEDDPTASVAAALLDVGVASVVAMSHSVLVETARRFVESFYKELATGRRVGGAMLAGQTALHADPFRLKIFGAGRLEMQDWFVPVLYQETEDLQLITHVPSRPIQAIDSKALEHRFGALPPTPDHTFIGRSRELLKLERLLDQKSYAVLRGQGGEGKTTLAAELARWLVRTKRFYRTVFVSVEHVYDVRTVVDFIGKQLVPNYSVAEFSEADLLTKALQPIERALADHRVLVVIDNMESILPAAGEVPRFEPEVLNLFFDLCRKLQTTGDTRLLFTSREALPKPFDTGFNQVVLGRLDKKDAIDLVHQAMTDAGLTPKEEDTKQAQPEVEALVEAVNCHARSLVLLAPSISKAGVRHTTENLGQLMTSLQKAHPDERERSLFASVALSLNRLSPEIREKIKPLGVFQGGGHIQNIQIVLELEKEEMKPFFGELLQTGLAEPMPYNFFRFHPALCPYLRLELTENDLVLSTSRWAESMRQLTVFLYQQYFEDAQLSATLTTLELPNLMRLLEYVEPQGEPEITVELATKLEQLLSNLGRKHLLSQVAAIREEVTKKLGDWSHTRFISTKAHLEQLLDSGNFSGALQEAQALLERCLQAGDEAYSGADYDTAMAYNLIGQVLNGGGAAEAALQPIDEAHQRFQRLADKGNTSAARMASVALARRGDCLLDLGRLDEAADTYEEGIKKAEKLKDERQAASVKINLGTVRMNQKRYDEALAFYDGAKKIFELLGEPEMVAAAWHQIGRVHDEANRFEAAEQAYRQSLAIEVHQNNLIGEAESLNQLGNLYVNNSRSEEAIVFYRQAADKFVEINDLAKEGAARNNLANTLIKLKRYDEARREILRAIECKKPYGHAATPWTSWDNLCNLEQAEGNREAAREAREQAIQHFLAYRRDGGENHNTGGRLCLMVAQALETRQQEEMKSQLTAFANRPDVQSSTLRFLIPKLQAILAGSRDAALAEDPELDYSDAVEIMLLLEGARDK